ncbi:hypothetical protein WA538_001099 [Blastocystis sp. DL]
MAQHKHGIWALIRHDADPHNHHHHKSPHSHSWMDGFIHSTIMILGMEFMDKTFFISAIMSMTHNKWAILAGSVGALFLMNAISCGMGVVIPVMVSRKTTLMMAAILFSYFGVKMIVDGLRMKSDENGELEEAQEEIKSNMKVEDVALESSPLIDSPQTTASTCKPMDSVVLQVFLMIFFAEWGDRSQVSTILLAGTHPVMSVFLGGCPFWAALSWRPWCRLVLSRFSVGVVAGNDG